MGSKFGAEQQTGLDRAPFAPGRPEKGILAPRRPRLPRDWQTRVTAHHWPPRRPPCWKHRPPCPPPAPRSAGPPRRKSRRPNPGARVFARASASWFPGARLRACSAASLGILPRHMRRRVDQHVGLAILESREKRHRVLDMQHAVATACPSYKFRPAQKSGPFRVVPDSVCDPHTILRHGVLSNFRSRAMRQLEIIGLIINWTSLGQPAKPVAGTLKIPGFMRRTEFIEGTGEFLQGLYVPELGHMYAIRSYCNVHFGIGRGPDVRNELVGGSLLFNCCSQTLSAFGISLRST